MQKLLTFKFYVCVLLIEQSRQNAAADDVESNATVSSHISTMRGFMKLAMSHIFTESFVLTFLAEWGDRSQISTIILAARDVSMPIKLPSTASQHYNVRERTHSLQLPEHSAHLSDCNFITHMLYKNTY